MNAPFAHLRVASGYSFQYGTSHPSALVEAAAGHGMDTLALTDRDGLYGAVRFAKACLRAGIAPVVGVDLAVGGPPRRLPAAARGGRLRDERLPRIAVLATSRAGWGTLCELISDVHLHGERSRPVATPDVVAAHCAGRDAVVMLGADSRFGELVAASDLDGARLEADRWRDAMGDGMVIAVTNHMVGGRGVDSAYQAAGMVRLARELRLPFVLTNAVRMAHRRQAATADVLDAARRLVPLDMRNVDRRNAEGHLKSTGEMEQVAQEVADLAGVRAAELLGRTRELAERCRLDPIADIGLGEIRLPEFETLGTTPEQAPSVLRARCESGLALRHGTPTRAALDRLDDELAVIGRLGFESYFLTVADVVDLIRGLGIRCAARGSGAGSLVNHALGISGVDPMEHGLLMERFLSPLRVALPDIDLDVESHRRTEIYEHVLERFGGGRVACVAMLETYRVRHAVRDVGAALGLPPAEIDAMAKAFPHIRARDARAALRDLPELRAAGLDQPRLEGLFELVESLDGLPRHVALHPCGVLLSDSSLPQRTPLEASAGGFPMSQFDKDDVEDLGLLKLDILGIRMQSAMSHALAEIARTPEAGPVPDIDSLAPFDDAATYEMIANRQTLGCFQIESPGQRELVGKFGPETFADIIIDISLFRPGPVKSDMVTPFLEARQGWCEPSYPHPSFAPALAETWGVVVFHEQIIRLVSIATGCTLAQGDEVRRALGDPEGQQQVREWLWPRATARGYDEATIADLWFILVSFASFGFCKAHAAAFALPTYQSAWLKRHYPAHFLAGILTHDPGMYPKRLLLEEARRMDVAVLGLDVNRSHGTYRAEATGGGWGIRLALSDVKGISEQEVERIVGGQPYASLTDFWARAKVTAPVVENLVLTGAFDSCYGIGEAAGVRDRGRVTRRDLLLAVADLQRQGRADERQAARQRARRRVPVALLTDDPSLLAGAQRQRGAAVAQAVQGAFDFGSEDECDVVATGLPEMDAEERLRAELEILGLDASSHIMERYLPFLRAIGAVSSRRLLEQRNRAEILVAGVKVATQTPPVRSGRRVIFCTLDDSTGPVDATFFEDVQGPWAATVFSGWMLLVRGVVRRTGPRGVSLRATGAWDLGAVHQVWADALATGGPEVALAALEAVLAETPPGYGIVGEWIPDEWGDDAERRAARARTLADDEEPPPDPQDHTRGGGMGRRRVLVHASGFKQSPYADVKPAGTGAAEAPRKLWHSSPGSSGR